MRYHRFDTAVRHRASFAFQGPFQSSRHSVLAHTLEGLFDSLCRRLGHARGSSMPGDYVARCKVVFTDSLIHELEASGYRSPAFDRLIQLRDAWDCGRLDFPEKETEV